MAGASSNHKSGGGGGKEEIDIENEGEFEESPAVAMLSQIQSETYQINIGGKKVMFDCKDQIFSLEEPINQ